MSDEKISEHKKAQQEKLQKAREKADAIRRDMEVCFSTPEGKRTLRWIMNECGYHDSSVAGNLQMNLSVTEGTLYNAARRTVYGKLRQQLPARILKDVEFQDADETEKE